MGMQASSLVFGPIELRLAERRLLVDGQPVGLGSRGFDLLRALVSKRDRVVSKDELLDEVWPGLVVEENNLQVQISGLRRVLGTQAIATVAGLGYRFTLAPGPGPAVAVPTDLHLAPPGTAARIGDVLVADDNRVNRLLLCRSLELLGHRVHSADNGHQALAMLRAQRYDLLLLDLAMPELDGFGLLQLRAGDAALREVAVIVTSALDGVGPVARCIELGADDFLHKPVDPWLLRARVESSLVRKQRQDQLGAALRRLQPSAPAQASHLADATILVARLRDPDALARTQPPQDTLDMLGNWCTLMFDAVAAHRGEVTQFSGDRLMALFAEPQAALQAAQDMAEVSALFHAERSPAGPADGAAAATPVLTPAIGLARGAVLAGTATTARRAAWVCMGAPVERAEWLAAECARRDGGLLMDAGLKPALAAGPPPSAVPVLVPVLVPVQLADGSLAYTVAPPPL